MEVASMRRILLLAALALAFTPELASADWTATHEQGNLSEWNAEYNSGTADSSALTTRAHTGLWSAKQRIDTSAAKSGTRLDRDVEIRQSPDHIYGAWLYFPTAPSIGGFFNLMQFKARTCNSCGSEVTWALYLRNLPDGGMALRLTDKTRRFDGLPDVRYDQTIPLPLGRWVHIEVRYVASTTATGHIVVWQDGVLLWDKANVRTTWACADCTTAVPGRPEWMINAYGEKLTPSVYKHYVDDVTITVP